MTKNLLNALLVGAATTSSSQVAREALAIAQVQSDSIDSGDEPAEWIDAEMNVGGAQYVIGIIANDVTALESSIVTYEGILDADLGSGLDASDAARVHKALGGSYHAVCTRARRLDACQAAALAYNSALEKAKEANDRSMLHQVRGAKLSVDLTNATFSNCLECIRDVEQEALKLRSSIDDLDDISGYQAELYAAEALALRFAYDPDLERLDHDERTRLAGEVVERFVRAFEISLRTRETRINS